MTRHVTFMTIDDAGHYSPEQRAAIVAAYPEHDLLLQPIGSIATVEMIGDPAILDGVLLEIGIEQQDRNNMP